MKTCAPPDPTAKQHQKSRGPDGRFDGLYARIGYLTAYSRGLTAVEEEEGCRWVRKKMREEQDADK